MKAFSLACTLAVATSGLQLQQEDEADYADAPIEDVEVIEVDEVVDEEDEDGEHSLYTKKIVD